MTTADARLKDAIKRRDFNALEAIIESGYVDIDPSIWLDAIRYDPGNLIAFKRLLKAGANVNSVDSIQNRNCLHYAVLLGNPDAVRLLITAGADLEAHTSSDETPLQLAVGNLAIRSEQVAMALIEAGAVADNDTLCRAAGLGMSMIRFLLNRNVNVRELRGSKQTTPCHHVALWEEDAPEEVLDMLVNVLGVDVNAIDDSGTTCFDTCAYVGSEKSMRWLLKAGAATGHKRCPMQRSPLHKACFTGNCDCIVLLIAYGINARLVDYQGRTALQSLLHDGVRSKILTKPLSVRLIIAMFALVGVDADKECAVAPPTADELASARRRLGDAQFDLVVCRRAFQVCLGLQPVWLPALVTCEILMAAFDATAPWVQFHNWWNLATTVKHFKNKK